MLQLVYHFDCPRTLICFTIVFVNLQKRVSISVPYLSENLVGCVIWGYILCDVRISKKSLINSSSFNFSRFIL